MKRVYVKAVQDKNVMLKIIDRCKAELSKRLDRRYYKSKTRRNWLIVNVELFYAFFIKLEYDYKLASFASLRV